MTINKDFAIASALTRLVFLSHEIKDIFGESSQKFKLIKSLIEQFDHIPSKFETKIINEDHATLKQQITEYLTNRFGADFKHSWGNGICFFGAYNELFSIVIAGNKSIMVSTFHKLGHYIEKYNKEALDRIFNRYENLPCGTSPEIVAGDIWQITTTRATLYPEPEKVVKGFDTNGQPFIRTIQPNEIKGKELEQDSFVNMENPRMLLSEEIDQFIKSSLENGKEPQKQTLEEKLIAAGYEKQETSIGTYYTSKHDISIYINKWNITILRFTDKHLPMADLFLPITATFEQIMETVEKLKGL